MRGFELALQRWTCLIVFKTKRCHFLLRLTIEKRVTIKCRLPDTKPCNRLR